MKRISYSIISLFILFLAAILLLKPDFHATDDVGIIMMLSGYYGTPDEHVPFMHVYFGLIYKFLYETFPRIAWYEFSLQTILFISWSCILIVLDHRFKGKAFYWFFGLIMVSMGLYTFCNIHFTFASCISSIASILLFLEFYKSTESKNYFLLLISSLVLAGVSVLIRPETLFMAGIIFSPVLIRDWFTTSFKAQKAKLFTFIFSVSLLGTSLFFLNTNYYEKNAEWSTFWRFLKARAAFTDYAVPYSKAAAASVNWSLNDYICIRNWFYADSSVYSVENLEKFVAHSPSVADKTWNHISSILQIKSVEKPTPKIVKQKVLSDSSSVKLEPIKAKTPSLTQKTFENQPSKLKDFGIAYLKGMIFQSAFLIFFWLFVLFHCRREKSIVLYAVVIAAISTMILFFIAINLKIPPFRIVFLLLVFTSFSTLMLSDGSKKVAPLTRSQFRSWSKNIVIFLLLVFSFNLQVNSFKGRAREEQRREALIKSLSKFRSDNSTKKFIAWDPNFNIIDMYKPFDGESTSRLRSFNIYFLGSSYGNPLGTNYLSRMGLHHLSEDLFSDLEILFLTRSDKLELYATFVREHFQKNLQFKLVHKNLSVFRVVVKQEEPLSIE